MKDWTNLQFKLPKYKRINLKNQYDNQDIYLTANNVNELISSISFLSGYNQKYYNIFDNSLFNGFQNSLATSSFIVSTSEIANKLNHSINIKKNQNEIISFNGSENITIDTIKNSLSASVANNVKNNLIINDGTNQIAYNGSSEIKIDKINKAKLADSSTLSETASKVSNTLTIIDYDGVNKVIFDGSETKTINLKSQVESLTLKDLKFKINDNDSIIYNNTTSATIDTILNSVYANQATSVANSLTIAGGGNQASYNGQELINIDVADYLYSLTLNGGIGKNSYIYDGKTQTSIDITTLLNSLTLNGGLGKDTYTYNGKNTTSVNIPDMLNRLTINIDEIDQTKTTSTKTYEYYGKDNTTISLKPQTFNHELTFQMVDGNGKQIGNDVIYCGSSPKTFRVNLDPGNFIQPLEFTSYIESISYNGKEPISINLQSIFNYFSKTLTINNNRSGSKSYNPGTSDVSLHYSDIFQPYLLTFKNYNSTNDILYDPANANENINIYVSAIKTNQSQIVPLISNNTSGVIDTIYKAICDEHENKIYSTYKHYGDFSTYIGSKVIQLSITDTTVVSSQVNIPGILSSINRGINAFSMFDDVMVYANLGQLYYTIKNTNNESYKLKTFEQISYIQNIGNKTFLSIDSGGSLYIWGKNQNSYFKNLIDSQNSITTNYPQQITYAIDVSDEIYKNLFAKIKTNEIHQLYKKINYNYISSESEYINTNNSIKWKKAIKGYNGGILAITDEGLIYGAGKNINGMFGKQFQQGCQFKKLTYLPINDYLKYKNQYGDGNNQKIKDIKHCYYTSGTSVNDIFVIQTESENEEGNKINFYYINGILPQSYNTLYTKPISSLINPDILINYTKGYDPTIETIPQALSYLKSDINNTHYIYYDYTLNSTSPKLTEPDKPLSGWNQIYTGNNNNKLTGYTFDVGMKYFNSYENTSYADVMFINNNTNTYKLALGYNNILSCYSINNNQQTYISEYYNVYKLEQNIDLSTNSKTCNLLTKYCLNKISYQDDVINPKSIISGNGYGIIYTQVNEDNITNYSQYKINVNGTWKDIKSCQIVDSKYILYVNENYGTENKKVFYRNDVASNVLSSYMTVKTNVITLNSISEDHKTWIFDVKNNNIEKIWCEIIYNDSYKTKQILVQDSKITINSSDFEITNEISNVYILTTIKVSGDEQYNNLYYSYGLASQYDENFFEFQNLMKQKYKTVTN